MRLKDKIDGHMCQVCATMGMLHRTKSLVTLEAETNDFTVWRYLKRQVVPLSGSVLLAHAPLSK